MWKWEGQKESQSHHSVRKKGFSFLKWNFTVIYVLVFYWSLWEALRNLRIVTSSYVLLIILYKTFIVLYDLRFSQQWLWRGLKMEVICSSKTSTKFYRTKWCYILEDITLLYKIILILSVPISSRCFLSFKFWNQNFVGSCFFHMYTIFHALHIFLDLIIPTILDEGYKLWVPHYLIFFGPLLLYLFIYVL
jgi:hypothetical protein